jgi:hypothetical protein
VLLVAAATTTRRVKLGPDTFGTVAFDHNIKLSCDFKEFYSGKHRGRGLDRDCVAGTDTCSEQPRDVGHVPHRQKVQP